MNTRIGHLNFVNNKDRKSKESDGYYFMWAKSEIKKELIPLMLTNIEISNAISRAKKNKKDIIKQSIISKLID